MNHHINLHIEGTESDTQPVEVEYLSENIYRVVHSPGFVEGIAAGDVIELAEHDTTKFSVVSYGGNVSVKISDTASIIEKLPTLDNILGTVGARRDGNLERVGVWTMPLKSGFEPIEIAIKMACSELCEPTWWFGNAYDSNNQPLNWWLD
ncbi:DUF4265 domain-containing protein [Reinekea sp. G2M2-21]|uniref:DUF4265 domain-containing protein n=1 Tax=Reinekea sp. G2M2-21 TaxID=2788942 RepID=UPI0018A9ECC8|nr:DUF4265 domain-containing protein [Reinekea sp. G2M2-21]